MKRPEYADALFEYDLLDPGSCIHLATHLHAWPRLEPFWTLEQYAQLDFVIWDPERKFLPPGRFIKHLWMQDHHYREEYGYALPTRELMDTLAGLLRGIGPVLEAGSGSGYLSKELTRLGVSTFAVDCVDYSRPDQTHDVKPYVMNTVHQRDALGDAPSFVSDRFAAVLMAWPPFDRPFAIRVAKAMQPGQILVYEGENAGGCTANSAFFEYMADECRWERLFHLSDQLDAVHVTFSMERDHWVIYRKLTA